MFLCMKTRSLLHHYQSLVLCFPNSMHEQEGHDITPDEEFLNYSSSALNGNRDLSCTAAPNIADSGTDLTSNDWPLVKSVGGVVPVEVCDATPHPLGVLRKRVFPEQMSQHSNGTNFYRCEANRLTSFSDWRFQHVVRKEDLVKNGFVFTGTSDKVRCIYCNGLLHHWEVKDVVNVEHKRNYPNCPFVRGANVGNIANMSPTNRVMNFVNGMEQRLITPIQESCSAIGHDIDPIEDGYGSMFINTGHRGEIGNRNNNVFGDFESLDDSNRNDISLSSQAAMKSMATEDARLDTFSHWSFHDKLSPDELVNAGLFSLGHGDRVKCFCCGVEFCGWQKQDDPLARHALHSPDCLYLGNLNARKCSRDSNNDHGSRYTVVSSPAVSDVLSDRCSGNTGIDASLMCSSIREK